MAMLYQRARRIAWNFQDPDRDNSGFTKSEGFDYSTGANEQVQRLQRSSGLDRFAEALKQDGAVIIQDFTDTETLEQANAEVSPWLQRQKKEDMKADGWMSKTRTLTRLMQRSPTVREKFFADNLYQMLCELFLTTESHTWQGEESFTNTCHPLLSSAITFDMPPVASTQALHRDDQYYHTKHEPADEYEFGRDVLLGLYVAGSPAFDHGSVRMVPGSHLWGDEKPNIDPDSEAEVLELSLKKGEALVVLGSMYHGMGIGGDMPVDMSQERLLHAMFSCSGVHRQEENPFLTYTAAEVKTFSELVQERLGWRQTEPSLGWVDLKSPQHLLEV